MKILILTEEYYDKSLKYYLKDLFNCEIKTIYKIDDDILNLSNQYCKDYLPLNFKYRLGSYIKGLNDGCNIIININDVNDDYILKILNKMNYNFNYYKVNNNIFKDYKDFKKINKNISFYKYVKNYFLMKLVILLINKIKIFIKSNIGFEINEGNFERLEKLVKEKIHYGNVINNYFYYIKRLKNIPLDKPKKTYKVGIINDYIPIDLYYNYTIEKLMGLKNIEPIIFNNKKRFKLNIYLYKIKDYCENNIGFNTIKKIYNTKKLIDYKCDGVLNIIDSNLISDIDSNIIINNMCKNNNIPLITLKYNEKVTKLDIENAINVLNDSIHIKNNNK